MLFSLLAVLAYLTYIRRGQTRDLAAVIVLFTLALASKPMAVTLPILLLLLDYWPLNRVALSGRSELHPVLRAYSMVAFAPGKSSSVPALTVESRGYRSGDKRQAER